MRGFFLKFVVLLFLGCSWEVAAQIDPVGDNSSDTFDAVVKKVYSAKTEFGSHYRAYVIDWRGSEVVVHDLFGSTTNKVGETISVILVEQSFRLQGKLYSRVVFSCSADLQESVDANKKAEKIIEEAKELLKEGDEPRAKFLNGPNEERVILPETLVVSDLEIPLLFEKNVSGELRQFILRDFEVLFKGAQDYELYDLKKVQEGELSVVEVDGFSLQIEKRLFMLSSRPPELLHKHLGDIVVQGGVDKVLVPELILDAYAQAFNLAGKFPREFEALEDFVRMITDSTEDSPFTLHPKDVFYMPGSLALARLEQEPEMVIQAQKFYSQTTRLRMASALSFEEVAQEQQKDGIRLKAFGYALKGQSEVPFVKMGFVYHDSKWKIVGSRGE